MTLYEIDRRIMDLVDDETGEVEDFEAFDELSMAREEKIENTALYIKSLRADAKAMKEEADALDARRKAAEKKVERLEQLMFYALGGEKFSTAKCEVSFRNNQRVEMDMEAVTKWLESHGHDDLVKYAAPTASKTDVKALLKRGENVDGARIVESMSMSIK